MYKSETARIINMETFRSYYTSSVKYDKHTICYVIGPYKESTEENAKEVAKALNIFEKIKELI